MFDIGFSELLVIATVALIGQERFDFFVAAHPAAIVGEWNLRLEDLLGKDVTLGIGHGDKIVRAGYPLVIAQPSIGNQQELRAHSGSLATKLAYRLQFLDLGGKQDVGKIRATLGAEYRCSIQSIDETDHWADLHPGPAG